MDTFKPYCGTTCMHNDDKNEKMDLYYWDGWIDRYTYIHTYIRINDTQAQNHPAIYLNTHILTLPHSVIIIILARCHIHWIVSCGVISTTTPLPSPLSPPPPPSPSPSPTIVKNKKIKDEKKTTTNSVGIMFEMYANVLVTCIQTVCKYVCG